MKHVFVILFALCVAWSVGVYFLNPTYESELPVMYWVTDRNPVREEQISRFIQWMDEKGYPKTELRLDTSNSDVSKKIIQGVSGVGADLMDLSSEQIRFFVDMGLLEDVTDQAVELGFSTEHTYKALKDILTVDGRQYAFPANVSVNALIVNRDQFKKLGIEPPAGSWNIEEFEKQGIEYVGKANKGLSRQLFFFSSPIADRLALLRSLGGSMYNETLTDTNINSPEYVQMLDLLKRWIDLGITPSAADVQSMATDSGYGGANYQLFNTGNYAMLHTGRHAIILLRQVGDIELSTVAPPSGMFPNITITSRAVGVYSGGKHKDLAPYFMAYLASDAYNETVVDSGDALPPDPGIAKSAAYNKPEGFEKEWLFHQPFADFAMDIAIPQVVSPYVQSAVLTRTDNDAHGSVMANMRTPKQAAEVAEAEIRREIERTLREHPNLRADHEVWTGHQREIDRLKAEGKKIPAEWVRNPFHLAYYRKTGQLEEVKEEPATPAEADKAAEAHPSASSSTAN